MNESWNERYNVKVHQTEIRISVVRDWTAPITLHLKWWCYICFM